MGTLSLAPEPATVTAALYGRQSRDNQESIGEQLAELRAVCADEEWPIHAEYQDGVSASRFTTKAREDWPRLMADLKAGRFNVLLLWESSRGDRDLVPWVTLLAECRDRQVGIYVHTHERLYNLGNARDWKALVEDGTDSAYESEKTSLRWKRHTAARAKAGKPHGFVRYGWIRRAVLDDQGAAIGSEDVLHPEAADLIRSVAGALLDGESLRSVVAGLNADGSTSPRGGPWSSTQLRQILLRASNAGLRVHRGKVVGKGDWEPIYDEDTHTRVVTLLTAPDRRTNKGSTRRHLGSGLFGCGRKGCGGVMRVNKPSGPAVQRAGRNPSPAYQCATCMRVRRNQAAVDDLVNRVMIGRLSRPDAIEALALGDPDRVRELREQIAGLEARLLAFADRAADGEISDAQLARINAKVEPQIAAARAELNANQPNPGILKLAGPDAAELWAAAPLSAKRAVIAALAEVTILPTGSGGAFDPNSVRITWRTRR